MLRSYSKWLLRSILCFFVRLTFSMALISRFFGSRKKPLLKVSASESAVPEFNPWRPVDLPSDCISLLVYRECDQRGRRLLFDSSSVVEVRLDKHGASGLVEVEDDTGFKYNRQRCDAKPLGEMVFGSVPMVFSGPSSKLHLISGATDIRKSGNVDNPTTCDQLMFSRVFSVPRAGARRHRRHGSSGTSLDDSGSSAASELSLLRLDGATSPTCIGSSSVECPAVTARVSEDSGTMSSADSFMGPPSCLATPFGTPISNHGSGISLGSQGSLQRSGWRGSRLRGGGGCSMDLTAGGGSLTRVAGGLEESLPRRLRTRLAVALLVRLDDSSGRLQLALTQLSGPLEQLVCRLQLAVERSYLDKRRFVRGVHRACVAARLDLTRLMTSPRLARPVWLGLSSSAAVTSSQQRQALTSLFVGELALLSAELDTKERSFFVTTLLTATLTHHLSWVPTVLPSIGSGELRPDGAVGSPSRPVRVLVTGRCRHLLDRVLLVLSYFMRARAAMERCVQVRSPLLYDDDAEISPSRRDPSADCVKPGVERTPGSRVDVPFKQKPPSETIDVASVDSGCGSRFYLEQDECVATVATPVKQRYAKVSLDGATADGDTALARNDQDGSVIIDGVVIRSHKSGRRKRRQTSPACFADQYPVITITGSNTDENDPESLTLTADCDAEVGGALLLDNGRTDPDVTADDLDSAVTSNRRYSDSIRHSKHYLRGYCSFRYSSESSMATAAARTFRTRHISASGSTAAESLIAASIPSAVQDSHVAPSIVSTTDDFGSSGGSPEGLDVTTQTVGLLAIDVDHDDSLPSARLCLAPWLCLGVASDFYLPDMTLWACTDQSQWRERLKHDLQASTASGEESVCIVADVDSGSVVTVSSHTLMVDRAAAGCSAGTSTPLGVSVVFSPLVSSLLESTCLLHSAGVSSAVVLRHLENQLFLLTSRAAELAQYLLSSPFTNMNQLTQALQLDSNDVPLLLAVASVMHPEVTNMYCISVR